MNSLDDTNERNCDYLLAINFFTAYLLQQIGRLRESLNFVAVAERMLFKLLSTLKPENKPSISARQGGLELIHEEGIRSPTESQGGAAETPIAVEQKKSQMTKTLLSNYLLGISLMKNIGLRFNNLKIYQTECMAQISRILEIESRYGLS